jgi:hypothetical protein
MPAAPALVESLAGAAPSEQAPSPSAALETSQNVAQCGDSGPTLRRFM